MSKSNDSLWDKLKKKVLIGVFVGGAIAPVSAQKYEDFSNDKKEKFKTEAQALKKEFEDFRDDAFEEFNNHRNEMLKEYKNSSSKAKSNKAEKTTKSVAKPKIKKGEQTLRSSKKEAKANDEKLEWHTIKNGKVDYACGPENLLRMNIRLVNVQDLMPKIYKKNNRFYCGTSASDNYNLVNQMAGLKIKDAVVRKLIYDDMKDRISNGDALNQYEMDFYRSFERSGLKILEKEGIKVTKDGKFIQQDPRHVASYEKSRR